MVRFSRSTSSGGGSFDGNINSNMYNYNSYDPVSNTQGSNRSYDGFRRICSIALFLSLILASGIALKMTMDLEQEIASVDKISDSIYGIKRKLNGSESNLKAKRQSIISIKNALKSTLIEAKQDSDTHDIALMLDKIITRNKAMFEKQIGLQDHLREIQFKKLEQKYGPGPYHVEFGVTFNGEKFFFAVETAPNKLMPHAVYTFLQMVEARSLEGKKFIHSPTNNPGRIITFDNGAKRENNEKANMLFPEYTPKYPHVKGTLGFTGLSDSNGMTLFMNLEDNDGKETATDNMLHEEKEPCIAKLVTGKDIVNKSIDAINTNSLQFVIHNVNIVTLKKGTTDEK